VVVEKLTQLQESYHFIIELVCELQSYVVSIEEYLETASSSNISYSQV